ncbi:MAG TPA: endonuclease III, partial [Armatimonadota bacterium]
MDWFPTLALRQQAAEITARLLALYHAQGPGRQLPPVDELIFTLLSQSTTDINSWRGYDALRARFADWDAAADAPVDEIAAAIHTCGLSRQKAPRIQALLQ